MKKTYLIYTLLVLITLVSCKSDDDDLDSITTVVQRIMDQNNTTALQHCGQNFTLCSITYFQGQYEFIGERMLRIGDRFFDLTKLERYEVLTIDEVKVMRLYFTN